MGTTKIVAGIDYSITSPAICVHTGAKWKFDNCTFFYFTKQKRQQFFNIDGAEFHGYVKPEYASPQQRFDQNAQWAAKALRSMLCDKATIEGYSFGSKGAVFDLAENAGLLKHYLWQGGLRFDVAAPSQVKKAATGKGNADKLRMQEAFFDEVPQAKDLRSLLGQTPAAFNPSSDLIDAYFICKLGFEQL